MQSFSDKELKICCSRAWAYLNELMTFSSSAIQDNPILSTVDGAITRNLGLWGSLMNKGEKYYHSYAFSLSLIERWSIRQYSENLGSEFNVDAYHYGFWATVNALMNQSDLPKGFFLKVHKLAMTKYILMPLHPASAPIVEFLLTQTGERIKDSDVYNKLIFFLDALDKEISKPISSQTLLNGFHLLLARPEAMEAIIQMVKEPGSLFYITQQPPVFMNPYSQEFNEIASRL